MSEKYNSNFFLQLPIYERVAFLENIPDHETFEIVISMPEFGFLKKNLKLQDRIYSERLDRYFSKLKPFFEEGISHKELYQRLVQLERSITNREASQMYSLARTYLDRDKSMEFFILYFLYPNTSKDVELASLAMRNNNIEVLEYLKESGIFPSYSSLLNATSNGYIEALQWIKTNTNIYLDSDIADVAAVNRQLEILKWLSSIGIYPSKFGWLHAAEENHIDVIKWAISISKIEPFTNYALLRRETNEAMYNLLLENDLLIPDVEDMNDLVKERNLEEIINIYNRYNILPNEIGASIASSQGYSEIVKWLAAHGIHSYGYTHIEDEEEIY